jgi:hypothetical protein
VEAAADGRAVPRDFDNTSIDPVDRAQQPDPRAIAIARSGFVGSGDGSEFGPPGRAKLAGNPRSAATGRRPRLKSSWNPCSNVFPSEATADYGTVTIALAVSSSGAAALPHVLSESPVGQGFGQAARACAAQLHFHPAVDVTGVAVTSNSVVRLKFAKLAQ